MQFVESRTYRTIRIPIEYLDLLGLLSDDSDSEFDEVVLQARVQ
jgi:hypothetical protein